MKNKILALSLSAFMISYMANPLNSFAYGENYKNSQFASNYHSKEIDYSLWDKFIRYDLCITDYDSLTDDEKELCKFIFETERSAKGTVRCERARRILADDENTGERITLEELENAYGIWDNYSPFKCGYQNYIHCVPDIQCLDGWDDYNEYWLDDEGTVRVQFEGENGGFHEVSFTVYSGNNSDNIEKQNPGDYIEYNGDYYYIKSDNTAVLVQSKYSKNNIDNVPVEEKIIIPDKINGCPVTAIENRAFINASVTEVILPDTIEFIDEYAFGNCIYLEKINIPDNLKYIGLSAFGYCGSLKEININSPKLNISPYAFYGCEKLADITLNVKSIDENAFKNCISLKNIKFNDGIERINANAFYNCSSIENIVLPSSLKIIGCGAFLNYLETESNIIKSITVPSGVETVGALPRAKGEGATSGLYYPPTDPLTEEQPCVFDTDSVIYGYKNTEIELYANEYNLNFIALDIQGDPNQDGEVNIADVVAVSSYVADSEKNPLSEQGIINADVHNSGNGLDANDCLMIQQYIADNISNF